jgi:hypothetical protein
MGIPPVFGTSDTCMAGDRARLRRKADFETVTGIKFQRRCPGHRRGQLRKRDIHARNAARRFSANETSAP